MDFEDLIYTKAEGIARIVINRPWVYNAFRSKTIKEMCLALEDAELDPEVRVVVLRGAGDKAFCTGGRRLRQGNGLLAHAKPSPAESPH